MKTIKRILIIRFRQIGDSILAVALCSTLKKSFPDAEIHFVLNKNIAPLYEGHPDIDKVITFDKNENKPFTAYIKKIWQVTHQNKYDVIIDMRSTIRTLFFSLFSLCLRRPLFAPPPINLSHVELHWPDVVCLDMSPNSNTTLIFWKMELLF